MKILVVDDEATNRRILKALLVSGGHAVVEASDGESALALYARELPDLVLLDVMMPGLDGYQVARRIKAQAHERFVPVVFLTALTDTEAMRRGIECGGDDFLAKPYNLDVLQSRHVAMERIRAIHGTLEQQRDALRRQQAELDHELDVGAHILATITQRANLDLPGLRIWSTPMSRFNGDLVIAARKPSGGLYILFGDFTGHGLSAAVGAIPAAEVFYGMAAKGFAAEAILAEINAKLRQLLPTGMFCAACLIELDAAQNTVAVWNGGLPEILIADRRGQIRQRIRSAHLPLGITQPERSEWQSETVLLDDALTLYVCSDGVLEATNDAGEMYGAERLERHFDGATDDRFDAVVGDLARFRAGRPQQDDITVLEIDCLRALRAVAREAAPAPPPAAPAPVSHWSARLVFEADALRMHDPLPLLMNLLQQLNLPATPRDTIYTVLAELFTNALDHGLLGVDSRLKTNPEGFAQYYARREERLATLRDGRVSVTFEHVPQGEGGALTIRVQDNGAGFDFKGLTPNLDESRALSGRGIPLVRSLCTDLRYHDGGRTAEAVYVWPAPETLVRCAAAGAS